MSEETVESGRLKVQLLNHFKHDHCEPESGGGMRKSRDSSLIAGRAMLSVVPNDEWVVEGKLGSSRDAFCEDHAQDPLKGKELILVLLGLVQKRFLRHRLQERQHLEDVVVFEVVVGLVGEGGVSKDGFRYDLDEALVEGLGALPQADLVGGGDYDFEGLGGCGWQRSWFLM